jgi:hypothetical protein
MTNRLSFFLYTIHLFLAWLGTLERLDGLDQVHRSEKLLLSSGNQTVSSQSERISSLLNTSWDDSDGLSNTKKFVNESTSPMNLLVLIQIAGKVNLPFGHTSNGQHISNGVAVLEVTI